MPSDQEEGMPGRGEKAVAGQAVGAAGGRMVSIDLPALFGKDGWRKVPTPEQRRANCTFIEPPIRPANAEGVGGLGNKWTAAA